MPAPQPSDHQLLLFIWMYLNSILNPEFPIDVEFCAIIIVKERKNESSWKNSPKNPWFSPSFPINCWSLIPAIRGWSHGCMLGQFVYSLWARGWGYADITGTAGHKLHQLHHTQQLTTLEIPPQFLGISMKIPQQLQSYSRANPQQLLFNSIAIPFNLKSVFEKCL